MQIVCILCGKEFKTRHDLKIHNAVHTGKRSFTCKQCNKSFTQAGTLGRHEKHHSDEKPFSSQHCSKTFHEAGQLKCHIRVHTVQKSEFVCLYCEKYFKTSQTLKMHSVVHTGKSPFHANNAINLSRKWALYIGTQSIILEKDHFLVITVTKLLWKKSD